MSNQFTLRILRELTDIEKSPDHQFQMCYNEEDVTTIEAMITGSPDTPYNYGLFSFKFQFPANYPNEPPKVVISTTNKGRTRFNPNLYASGKVCLSILGTWQARHPSEIWNSAHGISSILISIQSLMGENPYQNEPGFETPCAKDEKLVDHYKRKITHETIRISVLDRVEEYFTARDPDRKFEDISKHLVLFYYHHYMKTIDIESKKVTVNEKFQKMRFETTGNSMDGEFNYPALKTRLNKLVERINAETEEWVANSVSADWSGSQVLTFHNLLGQFRQVTLSKDFDGQLDIHLAQPENPYIWIVTVFGRPDTHYEGGIFRIRIVFHKDFPTYRPRVQFLVRFYHPNVSPEGVPFYRASRSEDIKSHLTALMSLFTNDPNTDPTTHLNPESAQLWTGSAEDRRVYARHARRCASESVECM